MFEFESRLIYRRADQETEGKLVFYLRWINMYTSAGSNQENNHFSLDNKSTRVTCLNWTLCGVQFVLPVHLDVEILDSLGHAHSGTNQSPEGLKGGTRSSFIIQGKSLTSSRCHCAALTRPVAF